MDDLESMDFAMRHAKAAINSKNYSQALAFLREAKTKLASLIAEGAEFRGFVTIQATQMSLVAGDGRLAQDFACMLLSETAGEMKRLLKNYELYLKDGKLRDAYSAVLTANGYFVAFSPYSKDHPCLSLDQAVSLLVPGNMAPLVARTLRDLLYDLEFAGWASWSYPREIEREAKYLSARALMHLAKTHQEEASPSWNEVRKVQSLAEKSLWLLEGLPQDRLLADVYSLLGQVFYSYEKFEESISNCNQSLEILESIDEKALAAIVRGRLGASYVTSARFEEAKKEADNDKAAEYYSRAEEHLRRAVKELESLSKVEPTAEVVNSLVDIQTNLGALYYSKKNWALAEETLRKTWDILYKDGRSRTGFGIQVLVNLGSVLIEQNKITDAEMLLREASDSIDHLVDVLGLKLTAEEQQLHLLANGKLGDALRRQEKWAEAYTYLDEAIGRLDSYRSSFVFERQNIGTIKAFRWIYEAMIDCMANLGVEDPKMRAKAFNMAENIKWRVFTAALRFQPFILPDMISEPCINEEQDQLKKMGDIALAGPGRTITPEDEDNIRWLEGVWEEWEEKYPDYVAIRRQKTVEAKDIFSLLDDQVPVLVEYYLGDELGVALAFVLRKGEEAPLIVRLKTSPKSIDEMVKSLRPINDQTPPPDIFDRISRQIHQSIIEPILPLLTDGVGVCVIPYGSLHNVPFSGLFDGKRYLIERHPIVVAQSATALLWWIKKNRHDPRAALIFTPTTRSSSLPDLKKFKILAKDKIAPLFDKYQIVDPNEATKERLIKELASDERDSAWDVVHIACHGVFKDGGLSSYLVMAGLPDDIKKDLTALEIFGNIRTDATLVTLSACDSSTTEVATGDDMAGLTQAFLFSGASTVLASVWYVRVGVGLNLIRRFYELWIKGDNRNSLSKIRAMQVAQQEVLKKRTLMGLGQKEWPNPYDWAPFQLYGDWR